MSIEGGTYYFRREAGAAREPRPDFEAALGWYARQAVPGRSAAIRSAT
jgi:hypothetical protein